MQEDSETLLALQRANMVAQYHQAHQAGSPQDLSLYKVTDHQGFLQDKELPGPSPREAKKLRQETRRADKWIKMLKRWDHYLPSEKEMKEAALVSSRDIMQIDLDVNRTFHSHTMFWDHYGVGQRALFHVLAAYSVYDTEVGYCQDMSEIAAIVLMFLPEDAFWALAQLMTDDRHAMHGRGADVHRHLYPKVVPAVLPRPDPLLTHPEAVGCLHTGWGAGAHSPGLHHPQGAHKEPPEAAPGRAPGVPPGLSGPALGPGGRGGAQTPSGLHDPAPEDAVRPAPTQQDLEFPTRPLGLKRVSPAPRPLLPSPASEPPPRVEEQASPGPATQPEPPRPPPGQAIVQLPPQRWNSLPTLPV
ncbi:ubiquitin carboxyl-terminal hydrolase 6-like isoform 2-T2 [Lycaon pictus]